MPFLFKIVTSAFGSDFSIFFLRSGVLFFLGSADDDDDDDDETFI